MWNIKNWRNSSKIIFVACLVVFLLVIILISRHGNKNSYNPNAGQQYDSNSEETISNPPGKGPDHYGSKTASPSFLGISSLLNYGVSFNETVNLQTAFDKYLQPVLAHASPTTTYVVSVDVKSIFVAAHNPNSSSTDSNITFNVIFNQKSTLFAQFNYSLLNDQIKLLLYTSNGGNTVFNSGTIGN